MGIEEKMCKMSVVLYGVERDGEYRARNRNKLRGEERRGEMSHERTSIK